MLFARLDPLMLVVISWMLQMLLLGWLPKMAVKRRGPGVLRDLNMVVVMLSVVRMFALLTLLLLAAMAQAASNGRPDLPHDASGLQPDRLFEWLAGEGALVQRLQQILFATLLYLGLQTMAFGWLRTYRRPDPEPLSSP